MIYSENKSGAWPKGFGGFLLAHVKDFLSYWHHIVKHVRYAYYKNRSSTIRNFFELFNPHKNGPLGAPM
jgi:hypothetical protein